MLGEMCEKVALKIVKDNLVKHFVIRRAIYTVLLPLFLQKNLAQLMSGFLDRTHRAVYPMSD